MYILKGRLSDDTLLNAHAKLRIRVIIQARVLLSLWCCSPTRTTASSFMSFKITQNDAPMSVGLLWTSDQLVTQTSIWQHTTLTIDRHRRPRRESNPQSQQASGRRPRPLVSVQGRVVTRNLQQVFYQIPNYHIKIFFEDFYTKLWTNGKIVYLKTINLIVAI